MHPAPRVIVEAVGEFDFASAEYRALLARSSATAFQHPGWLTPFYRHRVPAGQAEPLIITGRDAGDGRLMLMLALVRRRDEGKVLVEHAFGGVTDYACPVIARELQASMAAGASLAASVAGVIGACDAIRIEPVRTEHCALWQGLLGLHVEPLGEGAHAITFDARDEWRGRMLSPRRRSTLGRKARRLTDGGVVALDMVDARDMAGAFGELRAFRKGRFPGDPLQEESGFAFYLAVATQGAATGFTRTWRLVQGGTPVAVLFGLVDGGRFLYLLLGCDYERFPRYSPGAIMLDRVIAHWAGEGGAVFDMTIGDEPFKRSLGAERVPLLCLGRS